LPGQGPGLPADEKHRRERAPPLPPQRRAGPPCRAEDVAHALHEVRAPNGGAPARPRPGGRRAPRRRGVRCGGQGHRGIMCVEDRCSMRGGSCWLEKTNSLEMAKKKTV
jgi:hypothetical protein